MGSPPLRDMDISRLSIDGAGGQVLGRIGDHDHLMGSARTHQGGKSVDRTAGAGPGHVEVEQIGLHSSE